MQNLKYRPPLILGFTLALLAAPPALARVEELATLKQFPGRLADRDTWVIFDLDNTTLRQDAMIGTHQWGDHVSEEQVAAGRDPKLAKTIQYDRFAIVQPYVRVLPVEAEIRPLVRKLQHVAGAVFALTARPMGIAGVTHDQVASLGISFEPTFPAFKQLFAIEPYRYRGIVFSADVPKGELLLKMVNEAARPPKRIIFVDDKQYNLDSIEASFRTSSIDLLSLRYSAADPIVEAYDAVQAAREWQAFLQRPPVKN